MAQKTISLYDGQIPNSKACTVKEVTGLKWRISGVTTPTLTVFTPEKSDSLNSAVIIMPGGGYAGLAFDHEGIQIAVAFYKIGITAFVLKYRLPKDTACIIDPETVALMDAQKAIKLVRDRSKEFFINPNNVGIMGFSAGGHLASTLSTHYNVNLIENKENTNLRPSFAILGYPVISFDDSIGHTGSRDNMLGKNPSTDKIKLYSNDLQVTKETPATFIIHAADDKTVKVENSIRYYLALQRNKVASEIHLLQKGGHGFGLNNKLEPINWFNLVVGWLGGNNFYKGNNVN